jgi:ABC-2 type transport system permease protein
MYMIQRELKSNLKSLFFWSLGILFIVGDGIVEYDGFQKSGNAIGSIIEAMPESLQVILNMDQLDITDILGYYTVFFAYLVILCAVHAVMLGSSIIAKEERDKTAEFLLAKPISRERIILFKLVAGLIQLLIINAVAWISTFIGISFYEEGNGMEIAFLMIGLFLVQSIFLLIGTAIAAVCREPKMTMSLSAGVLLILYIASVLGSLYSRLDFLQYFTPFAYIDAHQLINGEGFDGRFIGIAITIMAALFTITLRGYLRRDMNL